MRRAIQFGFSRGRMEVFFLRDCQHGFEGEIKSVKPGFAQKVLIPQTYAYQNLPGFRKRLLPKLDESLLQNKIKRRGQVSQFQQKTQGIYLEFVKPPKFSNPNQMKEPIIEQDIISELNARFKLNVNKNHIQVGTKIVNYGQTTLTVDNYFSTELDDYTSFQIQIISKKPALKAQKLFEDAETVTETEESKKTEGKTDKKVESAIAPPDEVNK